MDFNAYKNTLVFPSKSNYSTVSLYKGGNVLLSNVRVEEACKLFPSHPTTVTQLKSLCGLDGVLIEFEVNLPEYESAKKMYHARDAEIHALFVRDLAEEFGMSDHPKKDAVFALAWEYGHSGGYTEVHNYYMDLVGLV